MLRKRIKKNTLKWKKIYAEQLLDMMDEEENALQKIYLTGYVLELKKNRYFAGWYKGKAGSGGQNAGSCAAVPGGNDVLPARPVLYRHHEGPRPAGGKDPDVEPSARAGRGVQLLPLAAEGKAGNGTVRKTKRRNMIQQYEMEPGIVQTIQWKRSGR